MKQVNHYSIHANIRSRTRIALASDLHDSRYDWIIDGLKKENPDLICIPGDLNDNYRDSEYGPSFLREAACLAPVFYSLGNHEKEMDKTVLAEIASTGTVLLDNSYTRFRDITVGGLTSGAFGTNQSNLRPTYPPDIKWLKSFASLQGFKLLLCHHPEYYPKYIRKTDIDLILSGHAHGGQWRFFGQGLFAPGQGIFPKYTSGIYDNRLVVSRGLANHSMPRIFNSTELVIIDLIPKNA